MNGHDVPAYSQFRFDVNNIAQQKHGATDNTKGEYSYIDVKKLLFFRLCIVAVHQSAYCQKIMRQENFQIIELSHHFGHHNVIDAQDNEHVKNVTPDEFSLL